MDNNYYKPLVYRNIKDPVKEALQYIDDRRRGVARSLKTRWRKFNDLFLGGILPNTVMTICGMSGAGKSSFINSLEVDLFELNPQDDFVILSLSFEMLSMAQIGRKLSYKTNMTTSEIYSGKTEKRLKEENYNKLIEVSKELEKHRIYYVDLPGNADQIRDTVIQFSKEPFAKGKWLIIILDHTLLAKGRQGENERTALAELQKMFMELKKFGRNTIIQLSQLNRNIETPERIANHSMHFPMRSDVFGGDSVFQTSDSVMVLHRPELLNIKAYGIDAWPTEGLIYLHVLKNREGELATLDFVNNLKYNRIDENIYSKSEELKNDA